MKKRHAATLFKESDLYALSQVVTIADEEDLNQFWEYLLSSGQIFEHGFYVFLVSLYELSSRFFLQDGRRFRIIIEQSDRHYHLTLWSAKIVAFIETEWKRQNIEYRVKRKRMTARFSKIELVRQEEEIERKRIESLFESLSSKTVAVPRYTFIHKDDLNELTALAEDAADYIEQAMTLGLTFEVFIRLRSCFSLISILLNHYREIAEIATLMTEFSMMLNERKEELARLNEDQIALIGGFIHNFQRWLKVLFEEGGAHLHYMDHSMRADIEMIRAVFSPGEEVEDADLNAVFDF